MCSSTGFATPATIVVVNAVPNVCDVCSDSGFATPVTIASGSFGPSAVDAVAKGADQLLDFIYAVTTGSPGAYATSAASNWIQAELDAPYK